MARCLSPILSVSLPVCPSLRLFPLYLLNKLTFDLDFFAILHVRHVGYDLDFQGQRRKANPMCSRDTGVSL